MRLLQSFKMAWHAVSTNKLRTFLTMLGIMIGVVALVVLVSIADGATTSVTDEISGMGSSYLTVTISDDKENPLKLSEISGFAEPDEVDGCTDGKNQRDSKKRLHKRIHDPDRNNGQLSGHPADGDTIRTFHRKR